MSKEEALDILKRIQYNPDLVDQLTEEEIEELQKLAAKKA